MTTSTDEHAKRSAERFGGVPEDYIAIHRFLDAPLVEGDVRHRALTHNSWFLQAVPERVFGRTLTNSDGFEVPVSSICELHIEAVFGCIPTGQDWLQAITYQSWMTNGRKGKPPSVE